MTENSHGLMSMCGRCGGDMAPTGKERLGPREEALGGVAYRTRSKEYRCGACGRLVWADTEHEDE